MAYSKEEAAEIIIRVGHELVEKGLVARTWGNISTRLSDAEFMITPSGISYDRLTPDKLVICKIEDCSYSGDVKPSSEKGVHAEAYRYREDVNFVIHTHQLYGTAVGTLGESLYPADEAQKEVFGSEVPCAEYAISSTKALKKKVATCIANHRESNAVFMRYHGVLCMGKDDGDALRISEYLEEICKTLVVEKAGITLEEKIGFPQGLNEEKILSAVKNKTNHRAFAFVQSSVVSDMSNTGSKVYPFIDDMAQIAGESYRVLSSSDSNLSDEIASELQKKAVVFIGGYGALCAAKDEDEVDAIKTVLEKNCLAGMYAMNNGTNHHLGFFDAKLQRMVYVKKYSKLK